MKPCKRCNGTGVWTPDHASEYDDADVTNRACLRCDGSGEVPTMEEERAEWTLEARNKLFKRQQEPIGKPTSVAFVTPDEWVVLVERWWADERSARIRAGACAACGEKKCPRVGGSDKECVP